MLNLDEMKVLWSAHDEQLDKGIRLNRELLGSVMLQKAHSATERMTLTLILEAAVWFAIIASLGGFIYRNIGIPRISLSAIALDIYAITMLAAKVRQIVALRRIDFSMPVARIQKQIEMLRVLRIRVTQWALLGGTIVWAPFVVVAARAFLGLDVANARWLLANAAFGLCLIPVTVGLSRAFGERMGKFPWIQRVMNDFAGRNLNDAADFLSKLSEFGTDIGR